MSEPRDERDQDQRPGSQKVPRRDAAVAAALACTAVGLLPCAIIFSLVTGTLMVKSIFVTIWLGLGPAYMAGIYCGLIGWWLTRNSSIDSRLMACALSAILELAILGWSIVIGLQPGVY
ncbi:MAG: hypothetical protein H7062_01075 [Candidatus Saccharimonas sp.]|nr:hypothetical protein [Planctomycetaceae bacterium]